MVAWKSSVELRLEKEQLILDKLKYESSEKVTSIATDTFSIENCMDVLESMTNISDGAYAKVIEKFTCPNWRKIFMKMSETRRDAWIKGLE